MRQRRKLMQHRSWPLIACFLMACGSDFHFHSAKTPSLVGEWRAVLTSPGGELPFTLRIREVSGQLVAAAVNAGQEALLTGVKQQGQRVVLEFAWYDSEITAELDAAGQRLTGTFRRTSPQQDTRLPFSAVRGDARRFLPRAESGVTAGDPTAVPGVSGIWAVTFRDDSGESPAQGEFQQQGDRVVGTFLTPAGDYRYLEGAFAEGLLRLATFDGSHAFLFHAKAQPDGTLSGDFWSRDTYHATWTARRLNELPAAAGTPTAGAVTGENVLPDPWQQVGLTHPEGRFTFAFPDLAGHTVAGTDARFAGKVVLVNLFGSWCPNCNDEAPWLAAWDRRYRDSGLAVVGLAFEFTGNPERDRRQVQHFAERHGITYPLLLAGISDKAAASALLPDLTRVLAYPTTIFIGRDGKVRKIHSGFAGPGTGHHHQELQREFERLIEELLAEPAAARQAA